MWWVELWAGLGGSFWGLPIIVAKWNEEHLPNFRMIAQKQIPPFGWLDHEAYGLEWGPKNKILPKEQFLFAGPCPILKADIPHLGWAPKITFYRLNPPQIATFVCGPPPNSQCIYPQLVEWTLWATGWSEPPSNKILPGKPTPRSNFCFWAFSQFSMQIPPFAGVDPAGPGLGWSPHK